ncbi:MAG: flagellar assembly peptidoglycan hydrolase FlgJ [Burkholderiales bacterium]|nr:flagellar assembly peptidoglycan hydrolase FlgJ [Burkholderiales bacterium]MDP2399276.1 flagellar assembly peptidoglycan hydrolase FlgJ [Burkholderiales bacterium]
MSANPLSSTSLTADVRGLDELRYRAKSDPDATLKDAARQFEVLFMNMLLKSMRDATPQEGMFDSEQTRFYTAMLDQQLSDKLSSSKRGLGLAEIMVRQLQRSSAAPAAEGIVAPVQPMSLQPAAPQAMPLPGGERTPTPLPATPALSLTGGSQPAANTRDFVNRLWPHAAEASRSTGIPAHFMIGQAALESGWGNREIRGSDGAPSHNLFGIKAGRGWSGRTVDIVTTEYVNGSPQKIVDRFRAYDSYADSFRDYANLMRGNPRYAAVLESGNDAVAFARGLQKAGYATDPQYADKLARVINGSVLRQSLQG